MKKLTTHDIIFKKGKEKIVALTCYDYQMAKIEDEIGIDIILIGDSVANVLLGYDNTLRIGMEEMIVFVKAVARGVKRALLVGDMPFLSFQISKEEAMKNAGLFIRAGCDAVKIEGGEESVEVIEFLIRNGIPVMGHIGLTPQWILRMGGYRVQGKTEESILKIKKDAKLLEEAGVFSIVLEGMKEDLAKEITESLKIPTIGIGAGRFCDGQILVVWDILGYTEQPYPKFVRKYDNLRERIRGSLEKFKEDVLKGNYPSEEEIY
ncbi:MAG: 3-methyl-2-oxobutanoate hydroxymethyltransferase [Candidatus Hydrothermales bacterium]